MLYCLPLEALNYALSSRQSSYCEGHEFGEFIANPKDCKLFYLCGENGEAVLASCPLNMLFNAQTKLCDNALNVQCETMTTTAQPAAISSTSSSAKPPLSTMDNMPPQVENYCFNYYAKQTNDYALVFIAHPHNCQQYYMCYQGQALLHTCSPQLHWNTNSKKCDLPNRANCLRPQLEVESGEEVEILPSLDEPIWGNGIKCPPHGEHIFPNIKRCDTFIYCVSGQAVLQACPFYQTFDVDSGRCSWRSKSVCVKDLSGSYRSINV